MRVFVDGKSQLALFEVPRLRQGVYAVTMQEEGYPPSKYEWMPPCEKCLHAIKSDEWQYWYCELYKWVMASSRHINNDWGHPMLRNCSETAKIDAKIKNRKMPQSCKQPEFDFG